jgi:hypothetical protein
MSTSAPPRAFLHADASAVELDLADLDHVHMRVTTQPTGQGAYAGAALVCEAITQARELRARHLDTTLDGTAPACGIVLDALHARIGTEVRSLAMHRAGASVLVDVDLLP